MAIAVETDQKEKLTSKVMFWSWDVRDDRLHCSRDLCSALSLSAPNDCGIRFELFLSIISEEDRMMARQSIDQALWKGNGTFFQFRTIPINGSIQHFCLEAQVIRDRIGYPVNLIGLVRTVLFQADLCGCLEGKKDLSTRSLKGYGHSGADH